MNILIPIIILCNIAIILIILKIIQKGNNYFKLTKILSIIYISLCFVNILLPDSFIMSKDSEEELLVNRNWLQIVLRWLNYSSIIILPIACNFSNRIYKNITISFTLFITLLNIIFIYSYVPYFTSVDGRGLNAISGMPEIVKNFLINKHFRIIWFSIIQTIGLLIPLIMIIFQKYRFNKKETKNTLLLLIYILFLMVPIYLPQLAFGYTNLIFKQFDIVHITWILLLILELNVLIKVYEKDTYENKYIICLMLALVTLFQYNSMFSLTISFKRLPLQLCNLASYFIVIALLTKNKHIFNFNLIVNVLGAFLAIVLPDINNQGFFNVWNMHFITEHSHIVIVPLLALVFNIFPPLDNKALHDALIGFSIYFVFCFIIGTFMNGLVIITNNNKFEVNYMFMFDMEKAVDTLPFIEELAKVKITCFKYFSIYPLVQLLVYFGYSSFCILIWFILKSCFKVNQEKVFINS